MSIPELRKAIGTKEKRHGVITLLLNVKKDIETTHTLASKWMPIAKENSILEKKFNNTKNPIERDKMYKKLSGDGAAIVYEFTPIARSLKGEKKEAERRDVDIVFREVAKIEKRAKKLGKKKRYDIKELLQLVEFIGPADKDELNRRLRGKTLKYKAEKFRIERYFYAIHKPYIKFVDIDEQIPLSKEHLMAALSKRVVRIRRGLISSNDVWPEQIIQYIQNNRQARSEQEILDKLKTFTVKSGEKAGKIDALSLEHDLLHLKGFPEDVWVPLDAGALNKAIWTVMHVDRIKKALADSFEKDIEHVLQGIDAKGEPLTEHVYHELKENYLGPKDWKILDIMRNSLVVKSAKGLEHARHRKVIPLHPKKEEAQPEQLDKAA